MSKTILFDQSLSHLWRDIRLSKDILNYDKQLNQQLKYTEILHAVISLNIVHYDVSLQWKMDQIVTYFQQTVWFLHQKWTTVIQTH